MSKWWVALLISTAWVMLVNGAAPSPSSPSADCSTIIFDMMDCVSFLSDGSKETKPTPKCCSGYQKVVSFNPECICVAIKSSGDLGIKLNVTKAMTLPSACGFPAPPVDCGTASLPPSGSAPAPGTSPSPANPPSSSPSPPKESPAPPKESPAPPKESPAPPKESPAPPKESPSPPTPPKESPSPPTPPKESPAPPKESPAPPKESPSPPSPPKVSPAPPKESPSPPSNDTPAPPSNDTPAPPSDGGDDDEQSPAEAPSDNDNDKGGSSEAPASSATIKSDGIYSTSASLVASMIVASVSLYFNVGT